MAAINSVLRGRLGRPPEDEDGDNGRHSSCPPSRRVSIEEYYSSQPVRPRQSSPSAGDYFDSPPSYDIAVKGLRLHTSRLKVTPREDEGLEQLPPYSCSIMIRNVFVKKKELESAVQRAYDRSWYKVFAELQGTALRFYKVKGGGLLSKDQGGATTSPDLPPWVKPGELLKTYSLQYADVGIAADYEKRRYVIRVRVEDDQFLLSCVEIETFLLWLESLSAAIDLAPPLDDRKLPRDLSLPRARRRRRPDNLEANENAVRQQEIIRSRYPHLAETIPEEGAGLTGGSRTGPKASPPNTSPIAPPQPNQQDPLRNLGLRGRQDIERAPIARPSPSSPAPLGSSSRQQRVSSSYPNPSISTDGKWKPQHQWSPMYDMIYARRCMAVLPSDAPRKTNFLIMRGHQWIIDWATGAVERWEPPSYGELEMTGPWGVAPGVLFTRV